MCFYQLIKINVNIYIYHTYYDIFSVNIYKRVFFNLLSHPFSKILCDKEQKERKFFSLLNFMKTDNIIYNKKYNYI